MIARLVDEEHQSPNVTLSGQILTACNISRIVNNSDHFVVYTDSMVLSVHCGNV